MVDALVGMVNAGLRVALGRRDESTARITGEIADLERQAGNLARFVAEGGPSSTIRDELATVEGALVALRVQAVTAGGDDPIVTHVDAAWVQKQIDRLGELLQSDSLRAKAKCPANS